MNTTNITYNDSQGVPIRENINIAAICVFPILSLILGSMGGIITARQIPTWYEKLTKPAFIPPNWLFGPAWTILYIMIGFSGYFVFQTKNGFFSEDATAWFFYFFQFTLNLLWTPLFFHFHLLLISAAEIVLMVISVVINIALFYYIAPIAAYFLLPYLCWISFATYMNWAFWLYNKEKKIVAEIQNTEKQIVNQINNENYNV